MAGAAKGTAMSISSLAASQVANPAIPAVMLNSSPAPAGPFALPASSGQSGAGQGGAGATSSLGASLAGGLSGALNAALLQLQQGAVSAGQAGQAANPLGTPAAGEHHHHHHRADADRAANRAGQGVGQGQTADAAAISGASTTPNGAGGLLLGDMTQALQTYTANGGVSLG